MIYAIMMLILLAVIALYVWGRRLPPVQQSTRDVLINAPMERVWAVMTDYLRQVEWRSDLVSVTLLVSERGREAWTERPRRGRPRACRIARQRSGRFLEIERLGDGPCSGHWTASLEQAAQATRVTLTETLSVSNPFVRVWWRTGGDPAASLARYERDLKQHLETFHGQELASDAGVSPLRVPRRRPFL